MKKVVVFASGLALLVAVAVICGKFLISSGKLDTSRMKGKEIATYQFEELQFTQENVFENWKIEGEPLGTADIVAYTNLFNGQELYNFNVYLSIDNLETKCSFPLSKEIVGAQPIYLTPYAGFCEYFQDGEKLEEISNTNMVVNGMLCFSENCSQSSFVEYNEKRFFNSISISITE